MDDRIKYGQIFKLSNGDIALICDFCCQGVFYTVEDFSNHIIKDYHPAEPVEEYCISSDTDCELIPPDNNEDTKDNYAKTLQNDDGCGALSLEPEDSLLIERDWVPPNSDYDENSDESIKSELSERKQRRIKKRADKNKIEYTSTAELQSGTQSSTRYSKPLRTKKGLTKRYECKYCSKTFLITRTLNTHMKAVHKK